MLTGTVKVTSLLASAVLLLACSGLCGALSFGVDDSISSGTISERDLDSCLNASSFFISDDDEKALSKDNSLSSNEKMRRSSVSFLATIYRSSPDSVGFAKKLDSPELPVLFDSSTDGAKAQAAINREGSLSNIDFSLKSKMKRDFISVAQLCASFNRVQQIARSQHSNMYYSIDIPNEAVIVKVDESTPSQTIEELKKDHLITISVFEPFELLQGRYDDYTPYAGGGAPVLQGTTQRCSLGYKVQNLDSWQSYMTIAGHCGSLGSRWYYGNKYVGYAVTNYIQQAPGRLDIAMLTGGNYAPRIFRGNGTQVAQVLGSLPGGGTVGANIGVSAAYSNQEFVGVYNGVSYDETSSASGCAWLGSKEYCNLRTVRLANGATLKEGDSGSPVFAYTANPNQVYALGTVTGWHKSRSTIYYTDIEALLNATHSRVATS